MALTLMQQLSYIWGSQLLAIQRIWHKEVKEENKKGKKGKEIRRKEDWNLSYNLMIKSKHIMGIYNPLNSAREGKNTCNKLSPPKLICYICNYFNNFM